MEIRASLLAAVAVAPVLGLYASAGRTQDAQGPDRQAPAAAPTAMSQHSGVETLISGVDGVAGVAKDVPVSADSDKSATGQSGARSKAGIETGAERRPIIKQVPGDGAKDGTWGAPIDASIAVHQGRRPNKDPKIMSINGRALLGRLLDKSKSPTIPGVAGHHDTTRPHQNLPGSGQGEPARNAVGAHIEHRVMAHRDTASPIGKSATQGFVPQGPSAPSPGAQRPASASTLGSAAATTQNRGMPPIDRLASPAPGAVALSAGGPAINGTAMIRLGSGASAIGGSVKTVAGVISGANVRMRHP
jgi:hypothetical protein